MAMPAHVHHLSQRQHVAALLVSNRRARLAQYASHLLQRQAVFTHVNKVVHLSRRPDDAGPHPIGAPQASAAGQTG